MGCLCDRLNVLGRMGKEFYLDLKDSNIFWGKFLETGI